MVVKERTTATAITEEFFEINELKAQAQAKDTVILQLKEKLRSLKGDVTERSVKREVEEIKTLNIELDHKVDVAPLVPKLHKNRTAHINYIRHTLDEAATLREIIESERLLSPLNTSLDYACCPNRPLKFLGMVRFGNDHVAKIMGYGDYQIRNVTIYRVYYMEGLGHNLFSVGQFCDSDLEASKTKSWLWHHHLLHLNFGAINHLARQGLVREAVATTCFTQNRSIVRLRHGKTPYELLHSKLPDLSFFHVFGALCYPTNDSENSGKLQPKADIRIFIGYTSTKKAFCIYNWRTRRIVETIHVDFDELTTMASEHSSSGYALNDITPGTISSGLVQPSSSSTSFVPPLRNDWDLLFQPMFDELLNPPSSVVNQAAEVIAPIAEVIPQVDADSNGSPSSTIVDQDAPSPKPKTYKEALTQACWIKAMPEELNEFERLEVWELVPRPD
nr:hypothetical protein [Tanacetum cinerariifolium]